VRLNRHSRRRGGGALATLHARRASRGHTRACARQVTHRARRAWSPSTRLASPRSTCWRCGCRIQVSPLFARGIGRNAEFSHLDATGTRRLVTRRVRLRRVATPRSRRHSRSTRWFRRGSFLPEILEPPPDRPGPLRRGHGGLRQRRLSTRAVHDLVAAMGIDTGISKSEVSRICTGLDERVAAFQNRTLGHVAFPLHRGAGYRRRIARSGTTKMALG
jgi:hypothetical protein